MRKTRPVWLLVCAAFLAPGGASLAEGEGFEIDARYRMESVRDDSLPDDAFASTLRLRLGYLSPERRGWQGLLEFEDVRQLGGGSYNSTANGVSGSPVVADPEDTELNQAWVRWQSDDRSVQLGRQRINIANQRFIGAVGFRQNEQTFDAAMLLSHAFGGSLQAGYIARVNRIFGAHHPDPELAVTDTQSTLFDYERGFGRVVAGAYAQLMNFPDSPETSHRNIGIRVQAEHGRLDWRAEYTSQRHFKDGARSIDAAYYRLDLGWDFDAIHAGLMREVLGGDGAYSFQTPFATLHGFNGATDKFTETPPGGLVDDALHFNGGHALWQYGAALHRFTSDTGSIHYGDELAAWATRSINEHLNVGLEIADYSADAFAADTLKIWFSLNVRY